MQERGKERDGCGTRERDRNNDGGNQMKESEKSSEEKTVDKTTVKLLTKKVKKKKNAKHPFFAVQQKKRNLTYTRHTADTILLMQNNVSRFSSLSLIGLSQKYVKSFYYAKVSSATDIHI